MGAMYRHVDAGTKSSIRKALIAANNAQTFRRQDWLQGLDIRFKATGCKLEQVENTSKHKKFNEFKKKVSRKVKKTVVLMYL